MCGYTSVPEDGRTCFLCCRFDSRWLKGPHESHGATMTLLVKYNVFSKTRKLYRAITFGTLMGGMLHLVQHGTGK